MPATPSAPQATSPIKGKVTGADFPPQIKIILSNLVCIPTDGISQRGLNAIKRLSVFRNPEFYIGAFQCPIRAVEKFPGKHTCGGIIDIAIMQSLFEGTDRDEVKTLVQDYGMVLVGEYFCRMSPTQICIILLFLQNKARASAIKHTGSL